MKKKKSEPVPHELAQAVCTQLLVMYPNLDKGFAFSLARLLIAKDMLKATPSELEKVIIAYKKYPEFKFCHIPRWKKDKLKKEFGDDCFSFLDKALKEPFKAHTRFIVWFLHKSKDLGWDNVLAEENPYQFVSQQKTSSASLDG